MILIPVKDLTGAKQRLASLLDQGTRTELAHAMLEDVLEAVAIFGEDDAALVTSDGFAMQLAQQYGFEIIRDANNRSETDAIEMATWVCEARATKTTLVIPGDIPLIEAADLSAIFQSAPENGSVLVPAADGRGTNAALRRPAGLFPLRFGNDSFVPHLAAAKASNENWIVLQLPGIALDIDTPSDLRQLAASEGSKRSQMMARRLVSMENEPAKAVG